MQGPLKLSSAAAAPLSRISEIGMGRFRPMLGGGVIASDVFAVASDDWAVAEAARPAGTIAIDEITCWKVRVERPRDPSSSNG